MLHEVKQEPCGWSLRKFCGDIVYCFLISLNLAFLLAVGHCGKIVSCRLGHIHIYKHKQMRIKAMKVIFGWLFMYDKITKAYQCGVPKLTQICDEVSLSGGSGLWQDL